MKRLLLCLAFVAAACLNAVAQTNLIATLTHNDKLSAFYGEDALKEAYAAAQDGDVITLSSGTFNSPDTIQKAISLKGAGMMTNGQTTPTTIAGYIKIKGQQLPKKMSVEGVRFEHQVNTYGSGLTDEITFSKCRINYYLIADALFVKCISCHVNYVGLYDNSSTQAYCTNSILGISSASGLRTFLTIDHCFITYGNPSQLNARNSIIYNAGSYHDYSLSASASYANCVGISSINGNDYFVNHTDGDNQMVYGYENLFKTYRGSFTDGETFELTDEAAAKYLGDDDTQVGIYGGSAPFDPVPSTAIVKKFTVKAKEKDNGNIGVTINVE